MRKNNFGMAGVVLIVAVCICNAISSFQKSFPAVISFDIQQDIGISAANLALLSGLTYFSYGLAQIPIGLLCDKLGAKRILGVLQVLLGFFTLIFVLSASSASAFFSRFFIGFLITATVPGLKIIASNYPIHHFSRISSFLLASGTFGALLAATPLVYAKDMFGWRYTIGVIGIFTIFCGLLVLLLPATKNNQLEQASVSIKDSLKTIFLNKAFWLIFVWFACVPGSLFTFGGYWLGPYLIQGAGMTQMHTSTLILISALFSTLCMPIFPIVSEKIVKSHKKTMFICTLMFFILFLPFIIFKDLNFTIMLVVYTAWCTLGSGLIPIGFALCREIIPVSSFGAASGALNMAGPIFASLFQIVFGYILNSLGKGQVTIDHYIQSFAFIIVIMSCGLLATYLMGKTEYTRKA